VDDKEFRILIGTVIVGIAFLISAVTFNFVNEDNQISKCIEKGNNPVECAMAFESYSADKILLQAIKEIK